MTVKSTLKLEELMMALAALAGLYYLQAAWWWYLLFLLGPDISFLAYLGGNTIGAFGYNLFHHKGLAAAVLATGWILNEPYLILAGLILFGHSSMDRFLGYGLKLTEGFQHTHLGKIGNKKV